ncbi:Glycosyltransferase involved in cell wall bisynthesis [Sphingomonas sp. NFR04]|nr:Glycosyltransferase involved in cell wall bisynthesis [Sphingomonas sp. NFR04]
MSRASEAATARRSIATQHIATSLDMGGAQMMLAKLIAAEAGARGSGASVLSLLQPGVLAPQLRDAGCPIYTLGMRRGIMNPLALLRLVRITARLSPDILQGWMYHGNLAATAAGFFHGGNVPVIWNVRHSLHDPANETRMTRRLLALSRHFAASTAAIIYNSHAAAREHAAFGFPADRAVHIPNGFDCDRFRPDGAKRALLRQRFGIVSEDPVVGMVARLHPMKDHRMLVEAAARARSLGSKVHLLLVGTGLDSPSEPLASALRDLPPSSYTLAGERTDVADWLPGVDLLALSSAWGEAFPNILGEGMACGVPCIATDVGDCAAILGEAGVIVPPGDREAMAQALVQLVRLGRSGWDRLGALGRERVVAEYDMARVAGQYRRLYASVLDRSSSPSSGLPAAVATLLPVQSA